MGSGNISEQFEGFLKSLYMTSFQLEIREVFKRSQKTHSHDFSEFPTGWDIELFGTLVIAYRDQLTCPLYSTATKSPALRNAPERALMAHFIILIKLKECLHK